MLAFKHLIRSASIFAKNAVNGFKNSLFIGGKDKKKTFQDILRLLDIFFSEGNKDDDLLNLIIGTFNYIDIDVFLNVLPQLLSRFDIQDKKILEVLFDILTKIGLKHPHSILSSLIVMKDRPPRQIRFIHTFLASAEMELSIMSATVALFSFGIGGGNSKSTGFLNPQMMIRSRFCGTP